MLPPTLCPGLRTRRPRLDCSPRLRPRAMQSFLGVSSSSGAECSATQSPFSALLNKAPGGSGPDTARRDLVPAQQQHHSASSSRFRSPHAQGHGQGQGQSAEAAAFFDQQAQQQQQHIGAIPHSSSSTSSAPPPPAAFDVHALRANLPSPQQHSAWHAQFVNDGATSGDSGAFAGAFVVDAVSSAPPWRVADFEASSRWF